MEIKSPAAKQMGARISVTGPGSGLYLVVGDATLEKLVRNAGGETVLSLGTSKLLAKLSFAGYLALRNSREISRIGPVTVDMARLSETARSLAKSSAKR